MTSHTPGREPSRQLCVTGGPDPDRWATPLNLSNMAPDAVIQLESLTKFYGPHRGIEALDLEVGPGEIFGFLGPNGAGKTTTIRLLLDMIRPTSGRARVLGMDANAESIAIRRRVGYLPGELALYENLTGRQLLDHFAGLRGLEGSGHGTDFSERLGIDLTRPIGTLSKGNKQKVGLAQAFMHSPDLLILDEPTSGLDPLVQKEFHAILRELAGDGKTIFLSSHVLSEIEEVAHRVGIIRAGALVAVEELHALKAKAIRRIDVVFATEADVHAFDGVEGVREAEIEGVRGRFVVDGSIDAFLKAVARYEVLDLVSQEPDLDEIFMGYYSGGAS